MFCQPANFLFKSEQYDEKISQQDSESEFQYLTVFETLDTFLLVSNTVLRFDKMTKPHVNTGAKITICGSACDSPEKTSD